MHLAVWGSQQAPVLQGHSSAEMAAPVRTDLGKRVSFWEDSPPSRSTDDSAMAPGPALQSQWVSETSRRKKLRLSGAARQHAQHAQHAQYATASPPASASGPAANGLSDDDSGPPVPRSHFSAPEQRGDWALHDTAEDGPPVPRSSFA